MVGEGGLIITVILTIRLDTFVVRVRAGDDGSRNLRCVDLGHVRRFGVSDGSVVPRESISPARLPRCVRARHNSRESGIDMVASAFEDHKERDEYGQTKKRAQCASNNCTDWLLGRAAVAV